MRPSHLFLAIAVSWLCLLAGGASAQQVDCYAAAPSYGICCGVPFQYQFPSDSGTNIGIVNWSYCCGHPKPIVDLNGDFCYVMDLRVPGVLDQLRRLDPNGRMMIASCSGELTSLPSALPTWSPADVPMRLRLEHDADGSAKLAVNQRR